MLLFEEGIPGWRTARFALDGAEAATEKFAEASDLKTMLHARPPAQLVDLRASAVAKRSPIKGALQVSLDDLTVKLKAPLKGPLLLVADHELLARNARLKLVEAGLPPGEIFVIRGGKPSLDQAKP